MEDATRLVRCLTRRREELGLSQTELAERLGMHQAAIARMENGRVVPRIDTLSHVARALGVRVELVLD